MKILIVNNYFRNTGDAALLTVLISQVKRQWPGAHIALASLEEPADFASFEGCVNIGSIRLYSGSMKVNKLRRMARKLLVVAVSLVWGRLPARSRYRLTRSLPKALAQELDELATADLVISTGGGYLNGQNSLGGNLNIWHLLLPLKLARQLHKPVYLAPQSFGPFGNQVQKRLVKNVLNRVQCILVREDKSFNLLTKLGVHKSLLTRAIDSGFAFDTNIISATDGLNSSNPRVGITARTWLPGAAQTAYEQALAGFINQAQATHNASVSLIPQVTSELYEDDDRVPERRIAALARAKGATVNQIDQHLSHHDVKQLYAGLNVTIGTRFHSVIFSLTSYVPAIAIEYEHKTSGIMQELGLDEWVIKIEDVTAVRLTQLFDRLINDHAAYVRHLHQVMPAYIARADATGPLFKQIYEQSKPQP